MACGVSSDRGLNACVLHWQEESLPLSRQEPQCCTCFVGFIPSTSFWYVSYVLNFEFYLLNAISETLDLCLLTSYPATLLTGTSSAATAVDVGSLGFSI